MIDWDGLVLAPLEQIFGEGGDVDGGTVMYYPAAGSPYSIDGIFDTAWRDTELIDPLVGATNAQPVLGVRLILFRAPPQQNDQVYIPRAGKMYLVTEVRPDSHGSAKLLLGEMQ